MGLGEIWSSQVSRYFVQICQWLQRVQLIIYKTTNGNLVDLWMARSYVKQMGHLWLLLSHGRKTVFFFFSNFWEPKRITGFLNLHVSQEKSKLYWAQLEFNIVRYKWKDNKPSSVLDNQPVGISLVLYVHTFYIIFWSYYHFHHSFPLS